MIRTIEKCLIPFAWLSVIILTAAVGAIMGHLIVRGGSALNTGLIFGDVPPLEALLLKKHVFEGIFPALFGTLILVLISVCLALPVGIAAGIYMAEYAAGRTKQVLDLLFDLLAAIPSIVVGLSGFSVTVFLHHTFSKSVYPCLLVSSFSLAFLILPYLIKTTQSALEDVPGTLRLTAPALGATPLQNIIHVLIPRAQSRILSGVILSIGRCAEDTAVIMLTGVVASAGIPKSVFGSFEALPFYIYYISSQYTDEAELLKGYGAALTLLFVSVFLFSLAFGIKHFVVRRRGTLN